jgi:hypothetical protein
MSTPSFPGRLRETPVIGVWGEELTPPDRPQLATVTDGLDATPENVQAARRSWPEGRAEDFEKIGKRRYLDKATGVEFKHEHGCPLLGVGGAAQEDIDCWFISGERLVFLRRADRPEARTVVVSGPMRAGEVIRQPNGRDVIQWEGS